MTGSAEISDSGKRPHLDTAQLQHCIAEGVRGTLPCQPPCKNPGREIILARGGLWQGHALRPAEVRIP